MFGRGKSKIVMVKSVGPLAAGTVVKLDPATADEYILKGYAKGSLSREYSDQERAVLGADDQVVTVG